jgi:peptidoglycan/xylan/chitin deacetylase (PgdA/CDA1 family)
LRHSSYIRLWYRRAFKSKVTSSPTLYLTFDDGPIPEVTPWVLETLKQWNAKATFFVIGENIEKHPEIFRAVVSAGHKVGNHTYSHPMGKKTDFSTYWNNIQQCATMVKSPFFRPPYGSLSRAQYRKVTEHFKLVMWDVMSYDFLENQTGEYCGNKVVRDAKNGDIIVFHDSWKAFPRLQVALPMVLEHFSKLGFQFQALTV